MEHKFEEKAYGYALKNAIAHNGKCIENSVISGLFGEGMTRDEIKVKIKKIKEIVSNVNSMNFNEQKEKFAEYENEISKRNVRVGLPEIPNSQNGVIMRFAPSPSGGLHIGHAITASLSISYVNKYGGIFYLRIEDTNPENIYPLAYDLLKEDALWLSKGIAKIVVQSDRMEIYYSYIEKMIKNKLAYVCTCTGDEFRNFSKFKKNCPCRGLLENENQNRWKKMMDKKGYNPGEAVVRFKTDMKHKNPAMRDFPLARINIEKHPRQGKKFRVWPLMNLCVSVDDIEMKMTHIIRAKDHRDNALRQEMIFKALNKEFPWVKFLGRIHFSDLRLSASGITRDVLEKKYSGWDDERLPTLAAIRKIGHYNPESFWRFAEHIGLGENDKIMNKKEFFDLLESFNRS